MELFDRIIPVPQKAVLLNGTGAAFGAAGAVDYTIRVDNISGQLSQNARLRLQKELERRFGTKAGDSGVEITLAMASAPEGMPNSDQGYSLRVENDRVQLTGYGESGLFYGVTTLLQCLVPQNGVYMLPAMEIVDFPSLKTRGHFIETRYGTDLMELEDWKEVIDTMVENKQNQLAVSVYGCWCVQFDNKVSEYAYVPFAGYPKLKTQVHQKYYSPKEGRWVEKVTDTPMYQKDFLGQLMAYGRENGVEVLPMINSLGHNTLIPRMYPEVSAKDENGEPSFTGYCTANPKTYELIFDLYDQLIDRYAKPNGIKSFDIGMDEVRDGAAFLAGDVGRVRSPWCKCPACIGRDRGDILVDHVIKLTKHLKERGMETVYMYNDMVVEHATSSNGGKPADRSKPLLAALEKNGLKDLVCLDWWSYTELRQNFHYGVERPDSTCPELGLRATVKPWNGYYNWAFLVNAVKNNYHSSCIANEEKAEGMRSYSTWDKSYHRNNQIQADYGWNLEGTGLPEAASARYVRCHFPTATEIADRAFWLMDEITRRRDLKDPKNTEVSRHEKLFGEMIYYAYTYYKKDRDYPRNYPGELVPKLREVPGYLEDIWQMLEQAEEAQKLFEQISQTPGCDRELALRFRYENIHYANICRDWITIAQMDELAQRYNADQDPVLLKQIARLAAAQKQSRLEELAELEQVKEAYLIPACARNQSIPMQYFADVEAYVTETAQPRLDFTDMRHIASQRFNSLR